jgi:dUTP pyrophosphatase
MTQPVLKVFLKDGAKLPAYAHAGDSGLDLVSPVDVTLYPLTPAFVDTGVHLEIPEGYEGQIRGRSSLNKKGVSVPTGTVDNGYHGSLGVVLIWQAQSGPHGEVRFGGPPPLLSKYEIKAGDKIAQLVIAPVAHVKTEQVQSLADLSETERGEAGWGSTGK